MAVRDETLAEVEDLATAMGLLTRLPVTAGGRGARAAWAWPLAGLVVALIAGVLGWLVLAMGAVPGVAAAVVIAVQVMLTGAMHEDGLGDAADGLFGGWTRERRLEIMKDSRIGSYAMLAILLVTLARWASLNWLMATGHVLGPLVAAAMLSRAALPMLMIALPPARSDGLSRATGTPPRAAAGLGLAIAFVFALIGVGWAAIACIVAAALMVAAVGVLAENKIGGQTGDILGAAQQMAEVTVLAALTGLI